LRVQIGQRLIQQKYIWLADDCPRQSHALPLSETWPEGSPPLALQKDRVALERFFSENASLLVLMNGEDYLDELHASQAMRFRELTRDGNLILLRGERN